MSKVLMDTGASKNNIWDQLGFCWSQYRENLVQIDKRKKKRILVDKTEKSKGRASPGLVCCRARDAIALGPPFSDSTLLPSFTSCFMITTVVTLPLRNRSVSAFPASAQARSACPALGQVFIPKRITGVWRKGCASSRWLESIRAPLWCWAGHQLHLNHMEACIVCQILLSVALVLLIA